MSRPLHNERTNSPPSELIIAERGVLGSRFIPTLDGWRALAVLLVIGSHQITENVAHVPRALLPLVHAGPAGVKIFFAISGYLTCTLLLMEFQQKSCISLRCFYTRRAFRILPAAFSYLAFISLATWSGWPLTPARDVITAALPLANNFGQHYLTLHFWSLSLEEQFYMLWPPILALLRPVRAARFAVAAFAAVTVWRFLYGLWWPVPCNRSDMALDVFFAPCCLAITLSNPVNRERVVQWLRGWTVWLLVAGIACTEFSRASDQLRHSLFALAFPLIVISTVLHPAWLVSRFLELAPLRWVGGISYSLYLWQQLFTWSGLRHAPLGGRVMGLFVAAAFSYYFIEQPFIRVGRRVLAQKRISAARSELSSLPQGEPLAHPC